MMVKKYGRYEFRYRYIYCYFVARCIEAYLRRDEAAMRSVVSRLAQSLNVLSSSDVMLFLAHLSRDPIVTEELISSANRAFHDARQATFDTDVEFIEKVGASRVALTYVPNDVDGAREQLANVLDELEAREDERETVSDVEAAMSTVRILGQIASNLPDYIEAGTKREIAAACYGLLRRIMGQVLHETEAMEAQILSGIAAAIGIVRPGFSESEVAEDAKRLFVAGLELVTTAMVKFASEALGSEDFVRVLGRLADEDAAPIVQLLDVSVRLDRSPDFIGKVESTGRQLRGRAFARQVLARLVLLRLTYFEVPFPIVQRACSAVGVQVPGTETALAPPQRGRRFAM